MPKSTQPKRTQAIKMEGRIARSYAKNRGSEPQRALVRDQARDLTEDLPTGARILEVAPGPGYLAAELARLGHHVVAVDHSHTFIEVAGAHARASGVEVDLRHGDAASLPAESGTFDLVLCQAAFKNFGEPVQALNEMHRVLRPGGTAIIQDMNHEATGTEIATEVRGMGIGILDALFTKAALTGLRRRAYGPADFRDLARRSAFGSCEVEREGSIGLKVHLHKPAT